MPVDLQPDQLSKRAIAKAPHHRSAFTTTEIRCAAPHDILRRLPQDGLVCEHVAGIRQLVFGWGVDEFDRQRLVILAPRVAKVNGCACGSCNQDTGDEVVLYITH